MTDETDDSIPVLNSFCSSYREHLIDKFSGYNFDILLWCADVDDDGSSFVL